MVRGAGRAGLGGSSRGRSGFGRGRAGYHRGRSSYHGGRTSSDDYVAASQPSERAATPDPVTASTDGIEEVALGTPNCSITEESPSIGSNVDRDVRKWVTVGTNNLLDPSGSCSSAIHNIFMERMDDNGYDFKHISEPTMIFYFEEFKKQFRWDPLLEKLIEKAWQRHAGKTYKSFICKIRKDNVKPRFMTEDQWHHYQAMWFTPEFKKIREQNSMNRNSSSGPSLHTGGSRCHADHAKQLAKELGRQPFPHEVFELTHRRKADGSFVDAKSKNVHEKFITMMEQQMTQAATSTSETQGPPYVDPVATYYEAAGGLKKQSVYGLGSQFSDYYATSSSTATSSMAARNASQLQLEADLAAVRAQLQREQEINQQRDAELARLQAELQQSRADQEQQSREGQQRLSAMEEQLQSLMNHICMPAVPPRPPT